ncbi:MAG: MBG domain-containing protein, partial [Oscillospiraceae bacterium]
TIVFPTREKVPAAITATMGNPVYNGEPVGVPTTISAVGDGSDVTLDYTYQWKQGDKNLDAAPTNVGDYTLVISGSNGSYVGSLTIPFTIGKRPLTVTAGNAAVVSGTAPEFTFTSAGLVTGETLTGVGYDCTYDKDRLDPGMARTAIIPHGGTVSSGNGNYAISYVPGTLTINPNKDALKAAIAATEALKVGIEVSDKTPGEVERGKRFVSSAVMTVLENAITAAKQVAGIALAPQEIADAMTALNEATNTFRSAFQTGTYSPGGTVTTPVPKPEPPKTDPGTGNTEVSVPVKPVTKGDTSSATVPEKAVSDAIAAAEKEAAKTGGSASVTITVDAPKDAKTVETTLPSKSLSAVAAGKIEGLKISTPVADLSFDSEALKNIAGVAGEDVKISATQVDAKALTDTQKSQVGDAPVFDFTVTSGDKTISNFNGGTATVSVPYTLKEGESPEFVTVWLLNDAGKLIPIEAKYTDGKIAFETGHFSRYAIGYLPFTDVKADWAYESIVYAYQNKLFSGVGDDKFAPTDNMNRAMLWTVLYRMAGSPGKTEIPANWYADAQAWAIANDISDGTNPTGDITREQL